MRLFLGCILTVGLILSPARAGASGTGSGDSGAAKAARSSASDASEAAAKPDASAEPAKASVESELEELRDLLLTQAQQLQAQSEQLKQQQEKMQMLEEQLKVGTAAPAKLAAAPDPQPASSPRAASLSIPVASAAQPSAAALPAPALPVAAAQGAAAEQTSPLSFGIGGARFTPGGFMDLTNVFRSKDLGSGIGSSFNSIPFNNALPLASLSEDRFSVQNSRVSLRVDSKVAGGDALGYLETDFLGFTNDNLNVTSNSNTLRLRLYFIDYKRGKWEVFGGQDWSMLTPNRNGIGVLPGDIFNTQDVDTNYNVGLVWERTPQFRFILHPAPTVTFGLSIENPQQFIGSAVTFPTAATAASPITFTNTQVDTNLNLNSAAPPPNPLATPNLHPDFIAKLAFDPKVTGHGIHVEISGLYRTFKINSFNGAVNIGNSTLKAGGGSINSNFEIFKNFRFIETAFFSSGGGRDIGSSNVPDFIVQPAANATSPLTLSPIHSSAGILGFEWQATPKVMLYGYEGLVYIGRNFTASGCGAAGTSPCGYGFTGSANSNNRSIQEPTVGWVQTFWRNPNYGALQLMIQASYLTRSPWFVAAGAPKDAHLGMGYVNLRYTLP
jgi:hypothetical protein